ncbi:glycosyltransferase [Streptomyces sp. NPDC002540]
MIRALAVIMPTRKEEQLLADCLDSLHRAARHPRVRDLPCRVIVLADACRDATAAIARRRGADLLAAGHVGAARATGSRHALDLRPRLPAGPDPGLCVAVPHRRGLPGPARLARPPPRPRGLRLAGSCGHRPRHGLDRPPGQHRQDLPTHYQQDQLADEHRHVHDANLAVRADAYRAAGGFQPLPVGEDRTLVAALDAAGFRAKRTGRNPVATSTRRNPRAHGRFGDFLRDLDALPG